MDIVSLAQRPDLTDAHNRFGGAGWPEFMLHDPLAIEHWGTLLESHSGFQLTLLDGGDIVAVANSIPLRFEGDFAALPDRGVDWGLEKGIADLGENATANTLMAVQIVVDGGQRGRGLSAIATNALKRLALEHGLESVIVPLRPSGKHRFPLIPMEDYLAWKRPDGLPYDGWLRVHIRAGGRIVGVCSQSMRISGTVADWAAWTGLEFPGSGRYLVPQALVPIEIDVDRDEGVYLEPNIWLVHDAAG